MHLDGAGVCGIGVELNVDYIAVLVLDLRGEVRFEHRVALDVPGLGAERTLDEVARLVGRGLAAADATPSRSGSPSRSRAWCAASTASSRTRPTSAGTTRGAGGPAARPASDCPVRVENDANLSAIAEWAMGPEARTPDLVYLTGEVGVGGGLVVDGRLLRGTAGSPARSATPRSVTRGGLRLRPARLLGDRRRPRRPAAGGRRPGRPGARPRRDLETRLAELAARADAGDRRTLAALTRSAPALGTGAAVLINLFNPQVSCWAGTSPSSGGSSWTR